ncbi:MAG: bifunctional glutamate N-acetyltransferase/amino-acid acetyltransferase ArgJ [Dehalococcoidia bacterium]|nr:bifunctional glutamate N-acetyltransferase/amino-acid acetyltransferase ArgJ [Dehalococcoidia bacterium]
MSPAAKPVAGGGVTSARGFLAGATAAGVKPGSQRLDLAVLFSTAPCAAAGVFTTNRVTAAPVLVCREHMKESKARAVVANSGCANASTGAQGMANARETASLVAAKLGLPASEVLVMSTGVIGVHLPMDRIRSGIERLSLSPTGGNDLAKAIITTDTRTKEVAFSFEIEGVPSTMGGVAKGAGMIHPNMATMLSVITTDARVDPAFLQVALKQAVDISFNLISIDGDTSTNDTVILLANGLARNAPIDASTPGREAFQETLNQTCIHLAREVARDGEGARCLIEVQIEGAATTSEARVAARTIVSSPLVKSAVYGADPNWGRVLAALGRSGAQVDESRLSVYMGDLCVFRDGQPESFDFDAARALLRKPEVYLRVQMGLGEGEAKAWGCDLTEEYVVINSAYTT